jgi:hypothetical protein
MWLSVPTVVVFALLFRGQVPVYRQALAAGAAPGAAVVRAYVWPVLPAVGLVGLVVWVVQANDYFWSAFVTSVLAPGQHGTDLAAYAATVFGRPNTGLATPLPLVLLAVAVLVVAQFYLDRVTIVTGPEHDPDPGGPPRLPAARVATRTALSGLVAAVWQASRSVGDEPAPVPGGARRPPFRAMLACGVLGVLLSAVGLVAACAADPGRAVPPPHVPGVPSLPPLPGGGTQTGGGP